MTGNRQDPCPHAPGLKPSSLRLRSQTRWASLRQRKISYIFLKYTRAMDTNQDWATKKEQEKDNRYSSHLGFINHLSRWENNGWKATQINVTTWVRGYLHTNQFLTRLETFGLKNKNTREAKLNRIVQTLPMSWEAFRNKIALSMSGMILKFFFIALTPRSSGHSNPYSQKSPTTAFRNTIYTSKLRGHHRST